MPFERVSPNCFPSAQAAYLPKQNRHRPLLTLARKEEGSETPSLVGGTWHNTERGGDGCVLIFFFLFFFFW